MASFATTIAKINAIIIIIDPVPIVAVRAVEAIFDRIAL
jgi:hypothetical protein